METASLACCVWALVTRTGEVQLVGEADAGDKQALSTEANHVILAFSLALAKLSDF